MKLIVKITLITLAAHFFLFSLCSCPFSHSQPNLDRATLETDRSMREEAEKMMQAPPKKAPKVEEEKVVEKPEGPKFLLKQVKIEGCESVSPDIFDYIVEKFVNREVTMSELEVLCKAIEREYLRQGIIAACFVPPQDVKEGVVILRVVEARMGELQIKDHPFFDKDRLASYWTIKPGEVLNYNEMSRTVQIMNKNPDRDVNATLHAGKKPGTTDVLLNVKTFYPIHVFGSLDNEGVISTGKYRWGLGLKDNNTLFVDDTLMFGTTFGQSFFGWYFYHSVPLTNFGTSMMYGYSDTTSLPKKDSAPFGIESRMQSSSLFLHQDIYKKAEYMGQLSIGMDAKDKTTTSQTGTINRDRLRVLRMKANIIHRYPGCITYMTPQLSQGLNVFGARGAHLLSSRQADDAFTKFNMGINHRRALPGNVQASVNFQCQIAEERLTPAEEMQLGGMDSVRGYPAGDYLADTAFQTNLELHVPSFWIPEKVKLPYAPQPLRDSVTGVLFFDHAYGQRRGKMGTEKEQSTLAGLGAGIRVRLFNQATARFEWGFPIGDKPVSEVASSRFHFSITFEDQLHKEFERISNEMREQHISDLAWKLVDEEMERPGSPVRARMQSYLYMARTAEENGDLKSARLYYANIERTGRNLFSQAEQYVRQTYAQREELKMTNERAMSLYREGDLDKAKQLWEKVKNDAQIKPLVFEI